MFLCIDTISSAAGITIVDGKFATHFILDPLNSSSGIIPTIDRALKKTQGTQDLASLRGVFVIKGPGSFTGLRVGLSVANQFAHQLKIPITGLRTDEWWMFRTQNSDALYLQTMNKQEVYMVKNGEASIIDLKDVEPSAWLGQLSADHRSKLSAGFTEITDLLSIEGTWQNVETRRGASLRFGSDARRTYDLIEPFYGKEPSITKRKNA